MTIEELKLLISNAETRTLELKKTTGELKDAMHSFCAMLNSDGGYVVIGIHPTTLKVLGQKVTDKTRQEVAVEIRKIEPHINPAVEYIDVPDTDGYQVLLLHADKSVFKDVPYVFNGKPYYKLESTTMQMSQQMYEDMLRKRDVNFFRWDSQTAVEMHISDLSEKRVRAAVSLGIRNGRIDPSAEGESMESLLGKLKLLNEGNPTNAAVALFANNTDRYPEMGLRMACFKGRDKNIFIDNKCEAGNFFDLLDAGIAFCVRNLRLSGEIKGLLREEKLEIPVEALREALTNALCHRQYERTNGSVSLAIYDDRVEIVNPGDFPAQLSPETIKLPHESYPHNLLIAQVLYLTTYLERWGSGAERIMHLCKAQNLPEPEWRTNNGTVSIIFKRPVFSDSPGGQTSGQTSGQTNGQTDYKSSEKTDKTERIINLIRQNPKITRKELSNEINISPSAIQRYLSKMKENGRIVRIGGDFGGYWRVNE